MAGLTIFMAFLAAFSGYANQQTVDEQKNVVANALLAGITLPYSGRSEVVVLDNGWIIVGLEPRDRVIHAGDGLIPHETLYDYFVLIPEGLALELVGSGKQAWLVASDHPTTPADADYSSTPLAILEDSQGATVSLALNGRAAITHDQGIFRLTAVDSDTQVRFRMAFRPVEALTPSDQSTSCAASCDHGSCQITCFGRVAVCYCKDGYPRCLCGQRLTIQIDDPDWPEP